jgi:hypothetical protein
MPVITAIIFNEIILHLNVVVKDFMKKFVFFYNKNKPFLGDTTQILTSNYKNFWSSIFATCELFRTLAKDVAEHLLFTYPIDDDRKMTEFLEHIRQLPDNAEGSY